MVGTAGSVLIREVTIFRVSFIERSTVVPTSRTCVSRRLSLPINVMASSLHACHSSFCSWTGLILTYHFLKYVRKCQLLSTLLFQQSCIHSPTHMECTHDSHSYIHKHRCSSNWSLSQCNLQSSAALNLSSCYTGTGSMERHSPVQSLVQSFWSKHSGQNDTSLPELANRLCDCTGHCLVWAGRE